MYVMKIIIITIIILITYIYIYIYSQESFALFSCNLQQLVLHLEHGKPELN